MQTVKQVLMSRDGMTSLEADQLINACKEDGLNRLEAGEMPFDIMEEYFGLEPDYLEELFF